MCNLCLDGICLDGVCLDGVCLDGVVQLQRTFSNPCNCTAITQAHDLEM